MDAGEFHHNTILFNPGISLSDLRFIDVGEVINKILVGSNGDAIELPNRIDKAPQLRIVTFSDGLKVDIYHLLEAGLITEDQVIYGGPTETNLIGGSGNDTLAAGSGNTSMIGGSGNDTLRGGTGHGTFYGGLGNDLMVGGSGGNTFLMSIGSGIDHISIPFANQIGTNAVVFGGGYSAYNPRLGVGSLMIQYGLVGDALHIEKFRSE